MLIGDVYFYVKPCLVSSFEEPCIDSYIEGNYYDRVVEK